MTKPCVLCEPGRPAVLYRLPRIEVLECGNCRLAYVNESLSQENISDLYQAENYYQEDFSFYVPGLEEKIVQDSLDNFRAVEEYLPGGRILDVGCADGAFLARLDPARWECHGLDISEKAIQRANGLPGRETVQFRIGELTSVNYPSEYFDAVTLWMLIEHLKDPVSILCEARRILKKGGIIIVKTPNRNSLMTLLSHWLYRLSFRRLNCFLSLYFTYLHIFFFDRRTLELALQKAGLEVVEYCQEERYVTRHVLSKFKWWQRPILRALAASSRSLGKMDALIMLGQKK